MVSPGSKNLYSEPPSKCSRRGFRGLVARLGAKSILSYSSVANTALGNEWRIALNIDSVASFSNLVRPWAPYCL